MHLFESSRDIWEVLVGDDEVEPVIKACSLEDVTTLETLLSQPEWIKKMFDEQQSIYAENLPSDGSRRVFARPLTNIERATTIAAVNGHAAIVSTLLRSGTQQGREPSSIIMREAISGSIKNGHASVIEALTLAWPGVLTFDLIHGALPIYEAVRMKKFDVVAMLLRLGADPHQPFAYDQIISRRKLVSRAAMCEPRIMELLLEHGIPLADSNALHTAAGFGQIDTARFLMERGLDVNEARTRDGWTPMHLAAWFGQTKTMKWLESVGGRPDAKDHEGKTPAEVLEQVKRQKSVAWTRLDPQLCDE